MDDISNNIIKEEKNTTLGRHSDPKADNNTNSNPKTDINISKIKHIVLSGGAYLGLYELGSLRYLQCQEYYSYDNILSIHGTSIGGLIACIMCIESNMDDICKYFIERPWNNLIQMSPSMLFDVIPKKGLIGREIFQMVLEPILKNNGFSSNITLLELYEKTNKELYMYSVSLNEFQERQISYKTHPELDIITAVHMTCALPYLVQPVWYKDDYYIDGGLMNNYPINKCFEMENSDNDNILSIAFDFKHSTKKITQDANIFEYGYILYKKLAKNIKQRVECKDIIKNQIIIPCKEMNLNDGYKALNNQVVRNEMIEQGENYARIFMIYNNNK
jgi:predicted acylesterase/phospholipase RssA